MLRRAGAPLHAGLGAGRCDAARAGPDGAALPGDERARVERRRDGDVPGLRRTTRRGDASARLWVYGRAGEACRVCGEPIVIERRGPQARSTYFCPRCQRRCRLSRCLAPRWRDSCSGSWAPQGGVQLGRPLRMYEAGIPYFLTIRCLQGRLFLRPSERTNEVIGGVLARAVRLAGVELFAFVFASNHLHLLVRAPRRNVSQFMQHLLTNLSKKVGAIVGWRGAFWERRYSAEPVLDDEALLGRIRYILSHGVKEGYVATCRDWPGLSSLSMMLEDVPRRYRWFHWSDRWKRAEGGQALRTLRRAMLAQRRAGPRPGSPPGASMT